MKQVFDVKAVKHDFTCGDKVLVLLPVSGAVLTARFTGPYIVDKRLNETKYVISTPDHRRTKHMCHVNTLKAYVERSSPMGEWVSPTSLKEVVKSTTTIVPLPSIEVEEEEFEVDPS